MTTIQSRRQLIVFILLSVAVAGACIRQFAARGTTLRDIGTLMLLLWIPIIGNVIAWLIAKARKPAAVEPAAPSFDPVAPFRPQLRVELTLRAAQIPADDIPIPEGEHQCAFVVGNEGFSGKWQVPVGASFRKGTVQSLEVEFLTPAAALPKFQRDTTFRMLVGDSFIGDGRVLQLL